MVDLITLSTAEPRPERPVEIIPPKPRPKPVVKRQPKPPEPKRVIAAPAEAPSPVVTLPPPRPEPEPAPAPVVAALPPAPPTPAPVVPITAPVFNADYLDNPPPPYPALSRRVGEEGRVILRVLVNVSGSPENVEILHSSGHTRLDEAALDTVRHWKFVPAKRGTQPVAAWVLVPVSFRLKG